jgi:hypothetical protein
LKTIGVSATKPKAAAVVQQQRRSGHISADRISFFGMIASLPLIRFGATIGYCADDRPLKMRCAARRGASRV